MPLHNAARWGDRPLPARGRGLEEKPERRLTSPPFLSQGHLVRDPSLQSRPGGLIVEAVGHSDQLE